MQRQKKKDGPPVDAPVLSRAVPADRREQKNGMAPAANPSRSGLTRGFRQAIGLRMDTVHPVLDRGGDGTDLLCPVTAPSQAQRFSSTAVYPTRRGQTLRSLSTLAARALRDTLLPR